MSNVISSLTNSTTGLTPDKILSGIVDLIPMFVIIIPIVLGIYFFVKAIKLGDL